MTPTNRLSEPDVKLLIISNMPHHLDENERVYGWGPTVHEIDRLATLFESVRHVAWLYPGPPPQNALPYHATNVRFLPLQPSGGSGVLDKIGVLWHSGSYIRTILRELPQADLVHVRCPASISLLALVVLALKGHPPLRWAKYAGNWQPIEAEVWSYRIQRWWLSHRFHRGIVTVNGDWPGQPSHIRSFSNPSLSIQELSASRVQAEEKQLSKPIRMLFVGRLEDEKGAGRALEILAEVQRRGLTASLDLVGDGPERSRFDKRAKELKVHTNLRFHGWLSRCSLNKVYQNAHFLLLPSTGEGWPKVLSEGMAYGVVPIAGAVSCIPQVLVAAGCGRSVDPLAVEEFAGAIADYWQSPQRWVKERNAGLEAARRFTYEAYLDALRQAFQDAWGLELAP